ncbi:uncharacterized protein LOC112638601 [Camponotus floridanus]|uniref:uncharacterized protein LOC112638601 n=1 Tax=Camponotus floridanus TaxID=104421 RepID=UPI000DC69628|nr:uncharacterized protein LOC112638601 [Camponotus floridanus]
MPNAYCVLCGNRDKLVSYYTFPKNKEFRKKWLSFCGINEKVLNTTTKLCSNHFQKEDIINKAKSSIIKPNAVPCIIIKKKRLHIENVPLSENYAIINLSPSSYERTAKTETVAEESKTNQIATDEIIVETEKVTEEIRTNQIATDEIENMYFNNASHKENIAVNRPSTPLSSRNIECFQTSIKTYVYLAMLVTFKCHIFIHLEELKEL